MKKKLLAFILLFAAISLFILNAEQSLEYYTENDGVIEWHNCNEQQIV